MSRPMWRVYEVRSKSWSSAPNTISTCSTELRLPTSRLSTRLRTSRPPSWASAQWSVAPSPISAWRCWNATVPSGEVLDAGDASVRAGGEMDLQRPGEERLRLAALRRAGRRLELLDERRRRRPRRDRRSSGSGAPGPPAADRPAQDDRAPRGGRRPARGRRRPGSSRPGSAGRACRRAGAVVSSASRRRASAASRRDAARRACRG